MLATNKMYVDPFQNETDEKIIENLIFSCSTIRLYIEQDSAVYKKRLQMVVTWSFLIEQLMVILKYAVKFID